MAPTLERANGRLYLTALNSALGGGEVHLLRLYCGGDAGLLLEGATVCLRQEDGPLTGPLRERGIRLWMLPEGGLARRVGAIVRELRGAGRVLLHIQCLPRDVDYLIAACLAGNCRTVIHLHTAQYGREAKTVGGWVARVLPALLRWLSGRAGARVLATSGNAARALFPGQAEYVWAPPIVADGAPELPERLSFAGGARVEVAFVGRLHVSGVYTEAKNIALAVAALGWVGRVGGRRVRLHLVADGRATEAVLGALREAGVEVQHSRSAEDPWAVIPREAVVLAPSRHEGFSMVVAEAQWHGRRTLISPAIPEEAVFVGELVRRMPEGAGAEEWGRAIVEFWEEEEIGLARPVWMPEETMRAGHIALMKRVHGGGAGCEC